MKKYGALLHWYIVATLICLGVVGLFVTGLIDQINKADITKLSFLIGVIFLYFTGRIGYGNWWLAKTPRPTSKFMSQCEKTCHLCWFVSDVLLSIGMIGTVIGFIYMLGTSFGNISAANTTGMRLALQSMGTGMSTALYTTAAGLVCSVLLKVQLHSFEAHIESKEMP